LTNTVKATHLIRAGHRFSFWWLAQIQAGRSYMADHTVVLRLNQQQLELLDRTIRRGEADSRNALVKRALAEHAQKNLPPAARPRMERKSP
jgi:Ribbon-helix-helix protein, copG family